jgi:hypothetical protein
MMPVEFYTEMRKGLDTVFGTLPYRSQERYSLGWYDPRDQMMGDIVWGTAPSIPAESVAAGTTELFPPSGFTIRWWHRVLHWVWKTARRWV